ncbi:retrotransposon protein, putative, ty1-copia subclass [Tanacetum coccineum]
MFFELLFMALDNIDRDALSKLLQMGTVAEYQSEFVVQDIEETTLHTSDKVEVVSTSMVATYEEHGCQDGFCMVATYEEQECQDGLKPVTTRSSAGKKGDLGAITSKGGPPDHMRASEKELVVLKSPLEQKSMFRRQERMLRRQEQQRLAKDAKIQRRIWDPGIKSIQDNTLRASDQDARYTLSKLLQRGTVAEYETSIKRNGIKRFDDEIKKFGFSQNADEPCVYLKASGGISTFLILYVDDILIMGNSIPMLQDVKSYLGRCFAMKDLGEAAYILGIKIYRDRSRRLIGLCQSAYIEKILKRFHMENSKRGSIPMQDKLRLSKSQGASTPAELKRMQNVPYASAVGSIMYAVRCTRPDVAFAQNITSRFQQNPGDLHWTTVKNILKYLRNTKDMFLVYEGDLKRELRVSCYTDAGYLTDVDDLKSQTGYVFVLNGGAVDWKSAKQSIFATSSAEAEYIAAFDASKEAVWVRKFIYGLGVVPTIEKPISMYCDNTGAIAIANESGITKGARHFHAKVHYLREVIEFGDIKLEKVHTYDNLADPFTKALAFPKHSELTRNIGMLPASSLM